MIHRYLRLVTPTSALTALASAVLFSACVDPLDINTPRRQWEINVDSIVTSDPFIKGPGDSIFASVGGEPIVFKTVVERPSYHNGLYRNAHYVTIQASHLSLVSRDYDIISLRLDAVRDTGVYTINGSYSAPKELDSLADPVYAAQVDRRRGGGFPETYRTGMRPAGGSIAVRAIDEVKGVMVGTFAFTAYSAERDTMITIAGGGFRFQIDKRQ
jgi:hypothetical protein